MLSKMLKSIAAQGISGGGLGEFKAQARREVDHELIKQEADHELIKRLPKIELLQSIPLEGNPRKLLC